MNRADHFLDIYEGFKLGDLGAGKPKLVRPPIDSEAQREKIRAFKPFLNSVEWSEDPRTEWLHLFPFTKENKPKGPSLHYQVDFYCFMRNDGTSGNPKFVLKLIATFRDDRVKENDGIVAESMLTHKTIFFLSETEGIRWFKKNMNKIKEQGADAVGFWRNWVREV